MASKPETVFIHSVHRHLPVALYRMKTHNPYLSGPADVWYSGPRADLWVEYKYVTLPKRAATPVTADLSALQLEWLRARHAEGRNVAVIIGCKEGGVILRHLAWERAMPCAWFRDMMLGRLALAAWIASETMT